MEEIEVGKKEKGGEMEKAENGVYLRARKATNGPSDGPINILL